MFWDKWIPAKFLSEPNVCAVEVLMTDEGTAYFFTVLGRRTNSVKVIEQGICSELGSLPACVSRQKMPVVICMNGKGIVLKKIERDPENRGNDADLIQQALPGMHPADFNTQIFEQEGNTSLVTFQRKEHFAVVLRQLEDHGLHVCDIFIGVPVLLAIMPLLSNCNYLLPNMARVEITNAAIDQVCASPEDNTLILLDIGELAIPAPQLLSFACAFAYLTGQQVYTPAANALEAFKVKHVEKMKFRMAAAFLLALIFAVCLVNFLFYSFYFSQAERLNAELGIYEDKYDEINSLVNDYDRKKNLIDESGMLENYFFSKHTDKIAATVPREVVLTDLNFHPLAEPELDQDSLSGFSKHILMIKGNCTKSLLINEWVNVLKSLKFIKEVNLEKFVFENAGNQPNFEIKIITR